jgi:outer membrane protein assembly factor BamB
MKKTILILGIIFLLIGINIIPSTAINKLQTKSPIENDIDWWPMFHHDLNRSGYSTSTGPDTNNVLWAFHVEDGIDVSSPAIVDNKVYFSNVRGNIFCLDSDTGVEVWNRTVPYSVWDSSPAVDNGKVYFAVYYNTVEICIYCLNATDGEIIWIYKIPGGNGVRASPVVYNGKVFIGAPDPEPGCMYCLDADTGEEIWISQTIDNPGSPAVYSNRVFFGADDFNVYCLDADDGEVIWKYKTGGEEKPRIHVAIYDDKLYAGGRDGLYCLDIEDGDLVWKYPTDDYILAYIYTTPCVAYGFVYFAPVDDKIYCLEADSGEKIWEYDTALRIISSPAVADGKVYIGTYDCFEGDFRDLGSGKIYCLDAISGKKIWEYDTASRVFCTPAIANGKIYVGTNDLYTTSSDEMYCFGGESENKPPQTPKEILGPKYYRPYVTYTYNTSTYDPDGDQLYYKWWWVEGGTDWLGPFNSNETVEINITFYFDYPETIKVIVQDSYYARSDWARLEVRVPRDKTIASSVLLKFLEQFPLLQTLLLRLGLQ